MNTLDIVKKITITLTLILSTIISISQIKYTNTIGGNYTQGNTGIFLVNLQSNIKNDSSKIKWSISPYLCYSKIQSNGNWYQKQRECYITTSFIKRNGKWNYYLFSDIENSYQKKIILRSSIGIGIGKNLIDNKEFFLSLSDALLPEIYEVDTTSNLYKHINGMYQTSIRNSIRIKFETKGKIKFNSIELIQPSIYNFNQKKVNNLNLRFENSSPFK
jgi:hypothetical protein